MNYQLIADEPGVKKLEGSTIVWVPADPANLDWQQYQAWLAQGNEPEPADPIEPAE